MIDNFARFENGELGEREEIMFFAELIKTKMLWKLKDFYVNHGMEYIKNNVIDIDGNIIIDLDLDIE